MTDKIHALPVCQRKFLNNADNADNDCEDFFRRLGEESLARDFDNQKDQDAADFYEEQFKKGVYAEFNRIIPSQ